MLVFVRSTQNIITIHLLSPSVPLPKKRCSKGVNRAVWYLYQYLLCRLELSRLSKNILILENKVMRSLVPWIFNRGNVKPCSAVALLLIPYSLHNSRLPLIANQGTVWAPKQTWCSLWKLENHYLISHNSRQYSSSSSIILTTQGKSHAEHSYQASGAS